MQEVVPFYSKICAKGNKLCPRLVGKGNKVREQAKS